MTTPSPRLPVQQSTDLERRRLTAAEFQGLADVPPEIEWFANIASEKTRRAYRRDLEDFMEFTGIRAPQEFRLVTRAHMIAWRDDLKSRDLAPSTIRRKLSALSSLFNYLCEQNAVPLNPVKGVTRPNEGANVGKTPAIADHQAARLLEAPPDDTVRGKRDRAILSTLLYQGLRREELCNLRVKDLHEREGLLHFTVRGKGREGAPKIRYILAHANTVRLVREYLQASGHDLDWDGPIFRPTINNSTKELRKALNPNTIWKIVRKYAIPARIEPRNFSPHALRTTAGTNAHKHGADLKDLQDWYGHANVSTTVNYIRSQPNPEDSPTLKVSFR